jgi:hypothetical protein
MSEEMPPTRRALIIWYSDETNEIELDDSEFSYLEVPELLRCALDAAELNAPTPAYETEDSEDE